MDKLSMTPPLTDEAGEKKLIALALRQAQKQLEDGTATSQVITHFLKISSVRSQIEVQRLKLENQLLEEKILAEKAGQQVKEAVAEVLEALKSYSYTPPGDRDVDIF